MRVVTADEAARLVRHEDAILIGGSESGYAVPDAILAAIGRRFLAAGATRDALQIHGAYGYSSDFPIEGMNQEAKAYEIWEGTSEIQRVVIARQLLKEYGG